ncbi:hypothetical protein [Sinisalibacter aestuarii]|uniref:Uncharacterized protein n=1 Tax=Sinisalibacter aestuarii TaxID=2949426 RepID=A0ABQ5LMP6_9RHOB|nr:hypothetical protein [Sinisalibacter aestuarii]GKY86229.1 hypothetical protein STA1M1_00980 [Sinisalibacter aestuarii]
MKKILAAVFLAGTLPAAAQTVEECDWRADMRFIAEPWEDHIASLANVGVRLAIIDMRDPVAVPYRLVVISPPYDEDDWPQCMTIGSFAGIDFAALQTGYDPNTGLIFTVPVRLYDAATDTTQPSVLTFSLNQASGDILSRLDTPVETPAE